MNGYIPVIRVEFEHMKHTMLAAVTQHLGEIEAVAEAQLEELLSDKNFLQSVRYQLEITVRATIEQSVREAVKKEVSEHLDEIVDLRWQRMWEAVKAKENQSE